MRRRIDIAAASILAVTGAYIITGCGQDAKLPPPAAPATTVKIVPEILDIEVPGPNLYFLCDGPIGIYTTEGSTQEHLSRASAIAVVLNHPRCRG